MVPHPRTPIPLSKTVFVDADRGHSLKVGAPVLWGSVVVMQRRGGLDGWHGISECGRDMVRVEGGGGVDVLVRKGRPVVVVRGVAFLRTLPHRTCRYER